MRLMGIDYGTKKVGIALTDESGSMAFPHTVLANNKELLETVTDIAASQAVEVIVVGQSLDLKGEPNAVQKDIDTFITALKENTNCDVHTERETFSTQEAMRQQGRNAKTDASAAALILDSYLQKQAT